MATSEALRKAAEEGDSEAQYQLGLIYLYGNEEPKDAAKAFVKMALRKYGIEPNGDTSALVGLSVIKDASNLW